MQGMPGPLELVIIAFIVVVAASVSVLIAAVPLWKICDKAGFPPVLSLLMLVPIANFILPFYIAFAEWPALRNKAP